MAQNSLEDVFSTLRRRPDVEAPNLQAWDATDKLLLEAAAGLVTKESTVAVIGDRYGALALGSLAVLGVRKVQVHQDLITGERALRNNAEALGLKGVGEGAPGRSAMDAGLVQLPLGEKLLSGAGIVLLQLPRSLAELEEIADAVARLAPADTVLLAGGRIKHMSLGMNTVLQRHFQSVEPQLARQKSRIVLARGPKAPSGPVPVPPVEHLTEIGLEVAAQGAVFAGPRLDIGTRFLLTFLPEIPAARHAVDLGCGTGILAAMYARRNPDAAVTATDQSAAAVASALATAQANGLGDRISVLQDDAMSTFPEGSADLILLNPPFHLGSSVHAGAGIKLFEAAGRVLAPGGELWTVFNRHLHYLPALERLVGPTSVKGQNSKFIVAVSRKQALP